MQAWPCAQDSRVQLRSHSSRFPALPTMLLSPLGFPARWGGCPRRLSALNPLLLWSYPMCAETAHYDVPYTHDT